MLIKLLGGAVVLVVAVLIYQEFELTVIRESAEAVVAAALSVLPAG